MSLEIVGHANILVSSVEDDRFVSALETIAASGCDGVGLPPLVGTGVDVARLRRRIERSGLGAVALVALRPGSDVASEDPLERAAGEDVLRKAIELAVETGARHLTGVPYAVYGHASGPVSEDAIRRSAESVGRAAERAHTEGVTMTFEVLNRYETSAINTVADALAYLKQSGSEHLGLHLDTFHMMIEETDTTDAISRGMAHLGYLEIAQSGRGPLSAGSVDVSDVVRDAVAGGYRGPVAFEAFSRPVLADVAADRLRVWRATYADGSEVLAESVALIRRGIDAGTPA